MRKWVVILIGLIFAFSATGLALAQEKAKPAEVKKECPSCGLGVSLDSTVCEFCGWDFDEEDPTETEASKFDLSYISLDGNIGCMVNGAGLAMATMDIIQHYGGKPANFLDVGGTASPEQVAAALQIILRDPRLRGGGAAGAEGPGDDRAEVPEEGPRGPLRDGGGAGAGSPPVHPGRSDRGPATAPSSRSGAWARPFPTASAMSHPFPALVRAPSCSIRRRTTLPDS
jgi:rubredoxin